MKSKTAEEQKESKLLNAVALSAVCCVLFFLGLMMFAAIPATLSTGVDFWSELFSKL